MLAAPTTTLLAFLLMSASGQVPDTASSEQPAQFDAAAQNDPQEREVRRREWREMRERARTATPEERSQMRLEGMVRMTARMYELDEDQTTVVREEILRMQAEREAAMGAEAEQYNLLREQMAEFWMRQDSDDGDGDDLAEGRRSDRWRQLRDDPEFRKIREGLRELESKYPFDFEAAAQRVEALLPADQAAKGRERREQRMTGWRERREQWRRERESDGEQVIQQQTEQRVDRRAERRRARAAAEGDSVIAPNQQAAVQPVQPQSAPTPALREAPVQPTISPPRPLHPWETHVRRFIHQHDLTEAQTTSAMAILRDVQTRAARIESAQADHRSEAEKITDPTARQKRLTELNAPIDQLFNELKQRLDGLLTAAQRQKVGK